MKWNPGSGGDGGLGPGLRCASSGLQRRVHRGYKGVGIPPYPGDGQGFCSLDGMKWNPGSGGIGGLGPGLRCASSGLQRRWHRGYKGHGIGVTKAVASGLQRRVHRGCKGDGMPLHPGDG